MGIKVITLLLFEQSLHIYRKPLGKTECQDQEEAEDVETEAEQDELLVECAGDVLSNFGKVIPPEDFALYFQAVLPMLLDRLV